MALNSSIAVMGALQPNGYQPHFLHAEDRIWVEKNCYVDLWIELLHKLRLDPTACLPFTLALDFEGDQWTFFKPSLEDLRDLYGVDVQELNLWQPLIEHAVEHLSAGKWISTEADAFWLPDTIGTNYRTQHTKTNIVLNEIDLRAQRLGYFHNAGYFHLEGLDFLKLFRLDAPPSEENAFLPPYSELIRTDRVMQRSQQDLLARSGNLVVKYVSRRPTSNPITRFQQRFEQDLSKLQTAGLAAYHRWAFANLRQLGAAFELAALHLQWQQDEAYLPAVEAFKQIALTSKALIMKVARAVNSGRTMDTRTAFSDMAAAWDYGMQALTK